MSWSTRSSLRILMINSCFCKVLVWLSLKSLRSCLNNSRSIAKLNGESQRTTLTRDVKRLSRCGVSSKKAWSHKTCGPTSWRHWSFKISKPTKKHQSGANSTHQISTPMMTLTSGPLSNWHLPRSLTSEKRSSLSRETIAIRPLRLRVSNRPFKSTLSESRLSPRTRLPSAKTTLVPLSP